MLVKKSGFNPESRSGATQVIHRLVLVSSSASRIDSWLESAICHFLRLFLFCSLLDLPLSLLLHEHSLVVESITSIYRGGTILYGHELPLSILDFSFLLLH